MLVVLLLYKEVAVFLDVRIMISALEEGENSAKLTTQISVCGCATVKTFITYECHKFAV